MDKLVAAEQEMFFDSPVATKAPEAIDFEVNADKYREFLRINPIWSYLGLSKEEYFKLSVQEKSSHIIKYYKHMVNGKSSFLLLLLFFFCCLLLG